MADERLRFSCFSERARRYFLAYLIFTSCLVAGQPPKYVLKGLEVNLMSGLTGYPDNILWTHDGNKVVEFNGKEEDVYEPFKNRITLDWHSADLSITHLGFKDSGRYELDAYIKRKLHQSQFRLEVIDEVAKPTISCEMSDASSSNISATLVCSAEPRKPLSLMKFEWSSHGNVQPGPNLTISLGGELDDEEYSCAVSNPLSKETATFTAKACYTEKSSSAPLIAGLVVSIFVVILVFLALLYCKLHHKACFAIAEKNGAEEGPAQGDEKRVLLDRAPTLPSHQRLDGLDQEYEVDLQDVSPQTGRVQNVIRHYESLSKKWGIGFKEDKNKHEESASPPLSAPRTKSPSHLDQKNVASSDKGDADAERLVQTAKNKAPQCENEPEPRDALADSTSRDMMSNVESSTAPEQQGIEKEETACPPSSLHSESPSHLDQNNETSGKKGEGDAEPLKEPAEKEIPQCETEPDPPGALDNSQKEMTSAQESFTAAERQESEKKADEIEKAKSRPANGVSPTAQPQISPNMAHKDAAAEQKEDANSDCINGESANNPDSLDEGKTNESVGCKEDEQSSNVSEQKSLETAQREQDSNFSNGDPHTSEDNQQEMDKPVTVDRKESDVVGDSEKTDKQQNQQSLTLTKPANVNTDDFQQPSDAARDDTDQEEEGKTRNDSEESGEEKGVTVEDENDKRKM